MLKRFSENFVLLPMLAFALPFVFTAIVQAETLSSNEQWKDPSSVRLEVDFPGNGYHASWQLFRCRCGDLLIRSELNVPGEVMHGDILLIDNRAVLMRGYEPENADQISLDAPALMMQLALRLLERAVPAGPSAVTVQEEVLVEDDAKGINLDTGAAVGGFPPPWSVAGSIWPHTQSQRRFDLQFSFNAGGVAGDDSQQAQMRLSGVAEYAAEEFPVGDNTEVAAWTLSWRDDNDLAELLAAEAGSVGELRQLLKANPLP
ncbi:MAG TPA: hypothetical protein VKN35_09935 [Xanthomonadales bacterium]|nr:hypothetical protein [Xanthomonadales bacterium]